jgi:hypothetical protein
MTLFGAFASALLTTLLTGGVAYYLFKQFSSLKAAGIAAFWLTFGTAGGRYSYSGPLTQDTVAALAALAGAALALILLWRWLLKRPAGEATNDDI